MTPKISIVTTSKHGNLDSLAASIYPFYNMIHEFIIINANSHRRMSHKLYTYKKKIKIIDGKGTNRSEGKNIGVLHATGNVIVFLNDDVCISTDWLKELKWSIKSAAIVAGWSPSPNGRELPRVPIYIDGQDITYPTCNIAYRNEIFDIVGLFNEKMITAEDIEFNKRCVDKGYIITYNPRMKVYHHHRNTFWAFAKQAFWNGYGRKQFDAIWPDLRHEHGVNFRNFLRLCFGFIGYHLGGFFL